jgi:hypothetical protein
VFGSWLQAGWFSADAAAPLFNIPTAFASNAERNVLGRNHVRL